MMPDPSSHRKSSISAAVRSPKKSGTPKAKGAVRAKSGCYTCRIRRKKCDEQRDDRDRCQTCVRLRLQCLGFGAKRPEYLKDTRVVAEYRERIKAFLASNGMIKGHSSTGARPSEPEANILRLVDDEQEQQYASSSASSSPSSPTFSPSSDEHRLSSHATSDIRGHYTLGSVSDSRFDHLHSLGPTLSPDDSPPPRGRYSNILDPSTMPSSLDPTAAAALSATPASLPVTAASNVAWHHHHPMQNNPDPLPNYESLALTSYLAPSYNYAVYAYPDCEDDVGANFETPSGPSLQVTPLAPNLMPSVPGPFADLVHHYITKVVARQYLLIDNIADVQDFIYNMIQKNSSVRDAACMLSSLHRQGLRQITGQEIDPSVNTFYRNLHTALIPTRTASTKEDVMAGLIVISSFLFSGGTGDWQTFLDLARRWVRERLTHPNYRAEQMLAKCSASEIFIIKTTMWFDVLGAITQRQTPWLIELYRELFAPRTYVDETFYAYGNGYATMRPPPLLNGGFSMFDVMGCENPTVLALAEITRLACDKDNKLRTGTLSMPALVEEGQRIEKEYLQRDVTSPPPYDNRQAAHLRRLASNIYRASARVYLHSVLSGDYPGCPEIRDGVRETVELLRQVPRDVDAQTFATSVVRNVVFSICICGCLTDDPAHRTFLLQCLEEQDSREKVGNVSSVREVLEYVWELRSGGRPVDWRDVMKKKGLLLV